MKISIFKTRQELGSAAADEAVKILNDAIALNGTASFVVATGASQFEFLQALCEHAPPVDWPKTTMFHLDEYIGLPESHPASFRNYLRKRLIDKVRPGTVNLIDGEADPDKECGRLNEIISRHRIDVAFTGIGENGHLAFNDPPADFQNTTPYLVVNLDERCRKQQLREGWFASMDQVPVKAISMSIHRIMLAQTILCVVPDRVKAEAVKNCLEKEISPLYPASILRNHPDVRLFLDEDSSGLLDRSVREG